jgi:hypothetical protein
MSEENEVLEILKVLVEKIRTLEETVYNQDNILMKSGFVKVDSPRPAVSSDSDGLPDSDTISKMSWDDLNSMVKKIEG